MLKFQLKQFFNLSIFLFLILYSCNSGAEKEDVEEQIEKREFSFTVEPAPEWTQVFKRDSGWFGGDGIFAIPYSGQDDRRESDSILFLFSDTMVGEIKGGALVPGYSMVHNSIGIYKKERNPSSIEFHVANNDAGKVTTMFIPDSQTDEYYWLGDGFVNQTNDNLYLFAYRIRDTHDGSQFPFEEVGNDLLVIEDRSQLPLQPTRKLTIPYSENNYTGPRISFGAGVYTEGDYIYIYGVRGQNKELVVARITTDKIEDFSSWEFKASDVWNKDRGSMQVISEQVSNELSVTKLDNGQYALIYQGGGIHPQIYMQLSDTPFGPFGKKMELWDTSKEVIDPDLFTYNAKAHPAISEKGELLVSYNVNSFKFFEIIESKPHLYRPRFIKIKISYPDQTH